MCANASLCFTWQPLFSPVSLLYTHHLDVPSFFISYGIYNSQKLSWLELKTAVVVLMRFWLYYIFCRRPKHNWHRRKPKTLCFFVFYIIKIPKFAITTGPVYHIAPSPFPWLYQNICYKAIHAGHSSPQPHLREPVLGGFSSFNAYYARVIRCTLAYGAVCGIRRG